MKRTACNISAKSEFGRFSIVSFIKTQALLYFCRLNTGDINPQLKETFQLNNSLDGQGFYSWKTFVSNVFKEIDTEITEFETFGRPFKSVKHSLKNFWL